MNVISRVVKYAGMSWKSLGFPKAGSPPLFTLFINSRCNMKCEHCFYW